MAETFVLPLGEAGLTAADLDLRLYRNLAPAAPAELAAVALVPQSEPGDYKLTNLPDAGVSRMAVTWTRGGVDGAYEWPTRVGSPSSVLIPSRVPGLTVGGISLRSYVDNAPSGATLTLTALADGGGYSVTGWPITAQGRRWVLVYEIDGALGTRDWQEAPQSGFSVNTGLKNWALAYYTASPLVLGNTEFDPAHPGGSWPAGGKFMQFSTSMISAKQLTTSGSATLSREQWGIYGRANGRRGKGEGECLAIAAELGRIFRGIEVAGVLWQVPAVRRMGEMPGLGGEVWFQAEMTIYGQRLARS